MNILFSVVFGLCITSSFTVEVATVVIRIMRTDVNLTSLAGFEQASGQEERCFQ